MNHSSTRRILAVAALFLCATLLALLGFNIDPATPARAAEQAKSDSHRRDGEAPLGAPAATRYVTNTNDTGVGSLRFVVGAAGPGDTINFTLTLPATITLTNGQIDLVNLTINGPSSNLLTISGNNAGRVFNTGGNVSISGVTIRDGNGTGAPGGGVQSSGVLTLTDTIVISNTANNGGGVFNLGGTLTIINSTVSDNSAIYDTGGVYNNDGTTTIINSIVSNNVATLTAGGIYNLGPSARLTLDGSTVRGNLAYGYVGGGLANESIMTITNSTISSNVVSNTFASGGGIYNKNALTITNTTINNNAAQSSSGGNAGGIYQEISTSLLTLNNVTMSGNTSTGVAGAIYLAAGTANLNNATIARNSAATDGGGVAMYGVMFNFKNTIIAGNTSGAGPDCYNTGSTMNSQDYNLIGSSSSCTITGTVTHNQSGDPKLTPLAWLGGSTQTHGLLAGSPALNNGNNANCLSPDQRGVACPLSGANPCDIGAFEGTAAGLYLPLIMR